MKPDRLDLAVIFISALCLVGVGIAAFFSDPSRQPRRVAYLYPASAALQNVWMADIKDPLAHQQLTDSAYGVYDFAISPDGRWLAYAERADSGTVTLRLLDIPSGNARHLVDCAALSAYCTSPVFSPDGAMLAYQRSESLGGRFGLSRIWLVDMASPDYATVPLIADTQVVGHSAVWSADGNTIAFYSADSTQPGILVYEFAPSGADGVQLRFLPTTQGTMGVLSPDGGRIIYPELIQRGNQFFTHLRIADLRAKEFANFTDPHGAGDDAAAQWHPDGEQVALSRRYTDARWTPGHQIYLRSLSDAPDALLPLVYDERYNSSYMRWHKQGDALVLQRFPLLDAAGAQPEVWVHELESAQTYKIMTDAYLPVWGGG
ncbi:MAG: hypothetical protein OXG92_14870 [Chloroflexi bacterium]|nr:hypothetical protein [Chloroflexota bacterium]MCY3583261.1 hypothetical protein [Chloroflexota bacterium]MCY3717730.1 hypothetical protein [Chloroflexota bacterium]MDE2651776.1 hypothetical protein [Chloroflexota bacterium]MXV93405.1 hypothetical protein [Chloroflexota bacterium]